MVTSPEGESGSYTVLIKGAKAERHESERMARLKETAVARAAEVSLWA